MTEALRGLAILVVVVPQLATAAGVACEEKENLWALEPVSRPEVAAGLTTSPNPIDAFVAAEYHAKGLRPVPQADRQTLLRRLYLDLIGLPPTLAEQETFLRDPAPDAYEQVVDRLLASEQHGVRYARYWLDVLRYADAEERMVAAPGIHLWRDWVINALNGDLPYDQFVRAQLTGNRSSERTQISSTGRRSRVESRPDDMFALGFLARGAIVRENQDEPELAIAAVETVSTAFMGLTVGCAKCHDHMYDPISQRDFYAMKALFDPLVVRKVLLGTPAEIFAQGRAIDAAESEKAALEEPINRLIAPYRKTLYEQRLAMLPADVQAIIRKPEKTRTVAEQRIADDYYPVLRIDAGKIREIMPAAERKKYQELQSRLDQVTGRGPSIPAFWTVEVDPKKALEKSHILTSGDPDRPEMDHEVEPGWPFAPPSIDFRDGRIEAFADWLAAADHPLFARVAVNRIWQWHFGEGLQRTPSDFGALGGTPSNRRLLDWLASEFVRGNFRMKPLHRLIVTSETYRRATEVDPAHDRASMDADPDDTYLWHYPLRRLEAEPIWDSILAAAGTLDLSVGGRSFEVNPPSPRRGGGRRGGPPPDAKANRRAAYMVRGYSAARDVMPAFLPTFDVDDGRAPCPVRTRTVSAPQVLFLMNSAEIEAASEKLGNRLRQESGGDLEAAVDLGYRITLARAPSPTEREYARAYLDRDAGRLKGFAWLLFNLDEFLYVR